jgi:hypothetical protein
MLTLGAVAGRLRLALDPAADFVGRIELQQPLGTPMSWPSGTSAWLHLSARGTSFDVQWPATISGAVMSWHVTADQVAAVPRSAYAELWLDYPDNPAFIWVEGRVDSGCGPTGIGCPTTVPLPDSQAVAVPVPGPAGPPGNGEGGAAVVVTGTAGAALSGHRAVVRRTDGRFIYADNTNPAHLTLPIGITTGAAASGGDIQVQMLGEMTEPSWAWTPGPIFLGAAGALTQTVPGSGFLAQLAAATGATTVFIDRSPSIQL